jgi:DNA-binding CsgD family transcriptional regulator
MLGTTPRCTNSPPDSTPPAVLLRAGLRSNAPPTSAGRGAAPPVELVQSLFDLTPAEARVARGLAAGKTVDDIAADGGTSANTIRTQVRGVLEKTGCNRQVDIVALLTAISATRLASPH